MAAKSIARRKPTGLARVFQVQNLRTLSQFFFAGFILYTAIVHRVAGEGGSTMTASAEAYCPFGGIEGLYKYVTSGGASFLQHTHLSNIVVLLAVLLTAVLTKSAFCGWICPFGAVQEWIGNLSAWLQRRFSFVKRGVAAVRNLGASLVKLERWLRYFKYVVLALIVYGTITSGIMIFRDYDPYAALLNLVELSFGLGTVVLAVTLVASFFTERPWCKYACPLGAIVGLVGKVAPIKIERDAALCINCKLCDKKCPLNVSVSTARRVNSMECNNCLICTEVCPKAGALELKLGIG